MGQVRRLETPIPAVVANHLQHVGSKHAPVHQALHTHSNAFDTQPKNSYHMKKTCNLGQSPPVSGLVFIHSCRRMSVTKLESLQWIYYRISTFSPPPVPSLSGLQCHGVYVRRTLSLSLSLSNTDVCAKRRSTVKK